MPETVNRTLHEGAHSMWAVGEETLKLAEDVLIPIAAGFAGYASYQYWGGFQLIYATIGNSGAPGAWSPASGRLAAAIAGGIWLAVGAGFWSIGKHAGTILRLVGKGVGAYFLGVGVGYGLGALMGLSAPLPNGALESLTNGIRSL